MQGKNWAWIFILYLILGVYFINFPFTFVKIPEIITKFNSWIIFVGGCLLIVGAFNYFKLKKTSF